MMMKGRSLLLTLLAVTAVTAASCAAPPVKPPEPPPPVAPPPPPPPPADVSDCRACHAGSGAYPLAADVYEHWETSGHGRFAGNRKYPSDCDACHDLSGEAGAGHLDGKRGAPTGNSQHLVAGYLPQAPRTEWDLQVTFDEYCWKSCHKPLGLEDMRHAREGDPAQGAVEMGQHHSFVEAREGYPMDTDLADLGFSGPPHYAPCVSCHDPHGSGATSMTAGSNRMVRENYKKPAKVCTACHK